MSNIRGQSTNLGDCDPSTKSKCQQPHFDRSRRHLCRIGAKRVSLVALLSGVLLLVSPVTEAKIGCKHGSPTVVDAIWGEVQSSPNYPEPPHVAVCRAWSVRAEANWTITISFEDKDIPSNGNCSDNQLLVGPRPVKICGQITDGKPVVYISSKDQLWMVFNFRGDHFSGRGFHFTYVSGPVPDPEYCRMTAFPSWPCRNGKCILRDWVCNGADECGDGSDEESCPGGTHLLTPPAPYDCGSSMFGCDGMDGRYMCFPLTSQCDGVNNCLDGSDESTELCGDEKTCTRAIEGAHNVSSPNFPNLYPNGVDCEWYIHVSLSKVVQLRFDIFKLASKYSGVEGDYVIVYDGTSAKDRVLGRYTAEELPPKAIESTGNRMYVIFHSDGRDSEEGFNATVQEKGVCLPHQLECQGEDDCYEPGDRCNRYWDCPLHGSDEKGCAKCPSNQFSCGSNNRCYEERERCNGANHCFNHQDEANCSDRLCNSDNGTFLCKNGRCIFESWQCDRTNDCADNSDETGCSALPSIKVITAAVVGSLICGLLLVIALGCTCKLHALRAHGSSYHSHRHSSPLSRLQDEIWIRQSAPPPYNEAMLTSRPFDEVQREMVERMQREDGGQAQQGRTRRNGSRSRDRGSRRSNSRSGQDDNQNQNQNQSGSSSSQTNPQQTETQNNPSSTGVVNPSFVAGNNSEDDVPILDDGDIFNDDDDVALIDALGGQHGPLEIEQMSQNSESTDAGDSDVQISVATGTSAQWRRNRSKTPSGNSGVSSTVCDTNIDNNTQGETASASNEIIISVDEDGNKDISAATFHQSGDLELTNQRLSLQSHDSDGSDGQSLDSEGTDIRSTSTVNTDDL